MTWRKLLIGSLACFEIPEKKSLAMLALPSSEGSDGGLLRMPRTFHPFAEGTFKYDLFERRVTQP